MIKYSHKHHHFRSVFTLLICIVFILFSLVGQAKAQTLNKHGITIVIPKSSSQYQRVVRSIKSKLNKSRIREPVDIVSLSDFQKLQSLNLDNKKLVVLIGSKSFNYYLKSKAKSPYITSLITRSAFNFIIAKSKSKNEFIGGVSIDQPPRRFVSLAKMIAPNLKEIALVCGPEVIKRKKSVLKDLEKYNHNYKLIEILSSDNPVNKLRKAYESNEVLIVFPDRKKFNSSLSRWLLTLSYQYRIPVISYSKKYAKAGALASLFSTSEQIGDQTAEMMISFLKNSRNRPKKLVDPQYFDIYINKSVAKALDLIIPSKFELLKKIPN